MWRSIGWIPLLPSVILLTRFARGWIEVLVRVGWLLIILGGPLMRF